MDDKKGKTLSFRFAFLCKQNAKFVHTFLRKKIFKPYIKMLCMRMIIFYQRHLSKHTCKYNPTCSQYTLESINNRGVVLGILLGAWRILRCNPLSKGGYDPASENPWKKRWLL
jgi:putative membrane protein insertion efficiency factor